MLWVSFILIPSFFFSGRGLSTCSSATTSSTRIWIELFLKKDSVAHPAMNVGVLQHLRQHVLFSEGRTMKQTDKTNEKGPYKIVHISKVKAGTNSFVASRLRYLS